MKNNKRVNAIIVFIAFLGVLSSCSADRTREDKVAAIINKVDSPFLIVNTSPKKLIEKSGAMDGALPFTQAMLVGFFIDESVTGVDYDTDIQLIVGKGQSFSPDFYGIFKLKNEEAFKTLLTEEANAEILEKDGFKYMIKEEDMYVMVWNEEFVIAANIAMDLSSLFGGGSGGNQGMKAVDKCIGLITAADEGEVNEDYKKFLENGSDVALTFMGKGFYNYMMEMSMGENEELAKQKETLEGLNLEMFLNFEDGAINLQTLTHFSDKLKEELNFFQKSAIKSSFFAYGNSANPIMTMGLNLDMSKALTYIEDQDGGKENLERELEGFGLTIADAKKGLSGEVYIVVDGVNMVQEVIDYGYGETYTMNQPTPIFAMMAGISDASVIAKLIASADSLGQGLVKKGDAFMLVKDNMLFTTNDSLWALKVMNGATSQIADKGGVFKSTPIGMYIDGANFGKIAGVDELQIVTALLKEVRLTGNLDEINLAMIFNDKTKNALRILTEAIAPFTEEPATEEDLVLEEELEEAAEESLKDLED
jgi:hypothetical protein